MGKNFKTTIAKFIKRSPFGSCLPSSSPPQIDIDGTSQHLPLKENSTVPTTLLSKVDSTHPSTADTFVAKKSPANNTSLNVPQDVKTIAEINNSPEQPAHFPDAQEVTSDDNPQNGVDSANHKQTS